MPDNRFSLRAAVYLVLFKDGKTLLSRRYNTGWQDGNYSLVAGHVDGNEPATTALIREVKEEVGLDLSPENVRVAHTMHRKSLDVEYVDIFFTAEKWGGEPTIREPEKCDDLQWFDVDNLPINTLPYIRDAIASVQKGMPYSETGWNGDAI